MSNVHGSSPADPPVEAQSSPAIINPRLVVDPAPDRGPIPFGQPANRGVLDWADAVDAAAARLIGSWVNPDTTDHMVASGLADEFAATLCAYGMAPAEVAHHLQDLPDDKQQRAPRDSHITPTGGSHGRTVDQK